MGIKPSATVFLSPFRSEQPARRSRRRYSDFDALEGRQLLSTARDAPPSGVAHSCRDRHVASQWKGNHHQQMPSFVTTNLVSDQSGVAILPDSVPGQCLGYLALARVAHAGSPTMERASPRCIRSIRRQTRRPSSDSLLIRWWSTIPKPAAVRTGTGHPRAWSSTPPATRRNGPALQHRCSCSSPRTDIIAAWRGQPGHDRRSPETGLRRKNVYKGLTIGYNRWTFLFLSANFHSGKIDVFDRELQAVPRRSVPKLQGSQDPEGLAPFNIQNFGRATLYVTYAKQDADKHDDVPGQGHGFVDVFDTNGNLLKRLVSHGQLDSPWGLAIAPRSASSRGPSGGQFRQRSHQRLQPEHRDFLGSLRDASNHNRPLTIDGLWGLIPATAATAGTTNTFSSRPALETKSHGLFGSLTVASM